MRKSLKMLSIISFSFIQSYSFVNDKTVDEYIYNKNGFLRACHYDEKIGENFRWDENGLVDNKDINILATHQKSKQ